jgi:hypothetical protein
MKLGLDELIIVNPGSPPSPRTATSWLLGADGGLYRIDHAATSRRADRSPTEAALGDAEHVPRYFLGDDGILYETR